MAKSKILSSWKFLVLLTGFALLVEGCSLSPGLQVAAGPSRFFAFTRLTEPVEEDDYILVPVTSQLIDRLESRSSTAKREIPAEEWGGNLEEYTYRVGPQDLLQVVVWDHPELSITATTANAIGAVDAIGTSTEGTGGGGMSVSPDGSMFFPLVGTLPVAGKTVEEIRELLTDALALYFADPQVDVRVIGFRSKKVHITGEVKEPRDLPITDVPLHLLDAISAAGGTTQLAALDHVRVIRNDRQIWLSLLDIYDHARPDENILLKDGDIVHVANVDILERIFVMGEVGDQGVTALERGRLSLAEALQAAGGINQDTADAARVMVLRKSEQKPLVYYLNANEPDSLVLSTRFPLQQSDIVYVATSDIHRLGKILRTLLIPIQAGSVAAFAVRSR